MEDLSKKSSPQTEARLARYEARQKAIARSGERNNVAKYIFFGLLILFGAKSGMSLLNRGIDLEIEQNQRIADAYNDGSLIAPIPLGMTAPDTQTIGHQEQSQPDYSVVKIGAQGIVSSVENWYALSDASGLIIFPDGTWINLDGNMERSIYDYDEVLQKSDLPSEVKGKYSLFSIPEGSWLVYGTHKSVESYLNDKQAGGALGAEGITFECGYSDGQPSGTFRFYEVDKDTGQLFVHDFQFGPETTTIP